MKKSVAYKDITNFIKKGINEGLLLPDKKIYSEADLVKLFNVSRTTAAKALDMLSREKVIYRIQGKGSFVSNPLNHNINAEKSNIVSLILPFSTSDSNRIDEFNVIRGIENYLKEHNYSLIINYGSDDPHVEMDLIKLSQSKNVDGIIVYPTTVHNNITFLNELFLNNYPIVFIDRKNVNIPIDCICSDNIKGGYLSTKHLISRGYDPIYFISDIAISSISSIQDRYFGYCKALKEYGYELSQNNLIEDFAMKNAQYCPIGYDNDPDYYNTLIKGFFSTGKRRVGIVCVNDLIAYSFVLASMNSGFKIAEEIGIVGFNDADIASRSVFPITTIKQNFYDIGKSAAKIVLDKINKEKHIKYNPIPVDIIIRSSS